METITYQHAQDLLKQANDKLHDAYPKYARFIEIVDTGFDGFNPTATWSGGCNNGAEDAYHFSGALYMVAKLLYEMPYKGAKVTF